MVNQLKNQEDNAVHVKMFGKFSITYKENSLLGKKVSETQFAYLMQILLHHRTEGVPREELEEMIFGDRDIKNIHHAMQSVIYNAKNKLRNAGLPETNYIRLEKGKFYWTQDIPVIEDASEFDHLYQSAVEETDIDCKLQLLIDACHCYTGEFLVMYAGVLWAASEARRYRAQFCSCVEEAARILREKQDYLQLEELGVYATATAPFSDWEGITMEALISMGRYEEASSLYADTVEKYFQERGIRPSQKLMDSMERLGDKMLHPYELLDNIQKELIEDKSEIRGGYVCSYPVFQGIYRMVNRMAERSGQSIYLMLCTIVDSKGNPMKDGEQLEQLAGRLGDAICKSIRRGDAVNRYGKGQYLVLLVNTTLECCSIVQKRINYNFLIGRQRTGVQYYVNSVVYEKDSNFVN